MGIFSMWIGDIPGSAAGVFVVKDVVDGTRGKADVAAEDFASCERIPVLWEGKAADSYHEAYHAKRPALFELATGLEDGAQALDSYGHVLSACQRGALELRGQMEDLDAELGAARFIDKVSVFCALLPTARELFGMYKGLIEDAKKAGLDAAAALYRALHVEPPNFDEHGQNIGELRRITPRMRADIDADLASLDYKNVNQKSIGDCALLASLMAMMATQKGREWLQNNIRWDEEKGGYLVTVYPDYPESSEPQHVLVTDIYARGVKGDLGKASVAAVLESAYGQIHPDGTRKSEDGIGDRSGIHAMGIFTGNDSEKVHGLADGYTPQERAKISEALAKQHPVVAATVNAEEGAYDNGRAVVRVDTDEGVKDIKLPGGHAYMVERVDNDGVWLCNPWGHNDDSDGIPTIEGSFKMSWDDFEKYYGDVDIGGGYQ